MSPKLTAPDLAIRALINSADNPHEAYPVPDLLGEFTQALDLQEIAKALIDKHFPEWPGDLQIEYLWKSTGGNTNGRETLGKTIKASGLTGFFSQADFIIWLAADHIDNSPLSRLQVEACLYHELLHVVTDEDHRNEIRPHDVEAFREEIDEYGFWAQDLVAFGRTVQRALPGFDGKAVEIPDTLRPVRPKEDVTITVESEGMPVLTESERAL